ncbi:MAG: response regulator transcription factor [Chloroflexi bacterium]|nr:response regulator transcription factor [Chloroflexota bacterium]PWB43325.1 MAG: DNA-binding response regulator [Dehalococcoidia bacterium]
MIELAPLIAMPPVEHYGVHNYSGRLLVPLDSRQRNSAGPPLRVLLADDHVLLRHALATLLGSRPGLEIVAEVADGHAAIEATEQWHPDVVIMDVGMPRMNGIEATRQIRARFPVTKIVILSAYGDAAVVGEALAAGACGFIIKRSDIDELALALRLIATGNVYVSSELAAHMDIAEVTFAAINNSQTPSGLTAREREVLQLIAEGHTMRVIAEMLVISVKTVEGHNSRIMAKVGAKNRAELVRYAIGAGLVRPEAPSRLA